MKVKAFLCTALNFFIVVLAVAQNGKNTQAKSKWTEAQASVIIKYGNQLVEFFNRNSNIIKNVESARIPYNNNKEQLKRNKDASVYYMGCKPYYDIPNRNNAIPAAPATYPDKSVPQAFSGCEAIFKRIKANCEAIQKYFESKEFVSDNFSKSDKMMTQMEEQADSVYAQMRSAINKASKLSDEAEFVFLQKSPIRHLIIPMKKDLNAFKDVLNELESTSTSNWSSLEQKLSELKEIYEKNKSTEGKDFSKKDIYYKTDVYPNFYKSLIAAIEATERYIKLDKENGQSEDDKNRKIGAQNNVYSAYNEAVDRYNVFIR